MTQLLKLLMTGKILNSSESEELISQMLLGKVNPEQIGASLALLSVGTPTASTLAGFARAFRKQAVPIELDLNQFPHLVDVCGTGGDGQHSFNISTCVSFVASAAGLTIAKHGNRAVSSQCGSFDVLDALHVPYAETSSEFLQMLRRHRLAFLYAPRFHPAFKALADVRRALGVRTILNALGPLLNPAGVRKQLIGVYSRDLVLPVAEALRELGSENVMVVAGADGADEVSLCAETFVAHLQNGEIKTFQISPEQFGLTRAMPQDLLGGSAQTNALILSRILKGEKSARRDVVILNAAAALVVGGKAEDMTEGLLLAKRALDSGKAAALLEDLQEALACGAAL